MVVFEDGTLVEGAYVLIDGVKYPVVMPNYSGKTPLNSENMNKLQNDLIEDIDNIQEIIETFTGTENATSGYCKLNNGLILQWGSVNANTFTDDSETGGKQKTVTFPIAFTKFNQCFCTFQYANGRENATIKEFDLETLTLITGVNIAGVKVNWFAIGM